MCPMCFPASVEEAGVSTDPDFRTTETSEVTALAEPSSTAEVTGLLTKSSSMITHDSPERSTSSPEKRPSKAIVATPMAKALKALQVQYAYLALPIHHLHRWVDETEKFISDGDEERAADHIARIEQEVEQEELQLGAAFNLFKPVGKEVLSEKEVTVMLKYLGFPYDSKAVDQLLSAIDTDGDRLMSLVEFQSYVGKMGGSFKLFEVRRAQMRTSGVGGAEVDLQEQRLNLIEAGINDQAQAYWRCVVPPSEFEEASKMVSVQREAIRHIRSLAKSNHEAKLPELQTKCKRLGYDDTDLWMTLAWIREMAPILVHTNLDKMMQFMEKDTHYRNQFETATSGGLLKPAVREKWERDLFGGTYEHAKGFDRCKYGVQNVMNDYRGVVKCAQYGDSYLVLKDVRLRCTFAPEDSANLKAERLAVLDFYAHVLNDYSDKELAETMKVAKSTDAALLGDSSQVGAMKYKEAQIHGEVAFGKHVDRLVAHVRHRAKDGGRLKKICAKHGWNFSWMDEERGRMEAEEKHKLGADAWKSRLQDIMSKVPDAKDVPEGFCRKGCCRKVAPGSTGAGRAFTTCCRGCAMGFGHDLNCGNIDAEKMGPGMCTNGCGLKVNPGKHPSGRSFTTCCRSCAKGYHDAMCGKELNASNMGAGLCKMGCGRAVAVGAGGRKFDTCCRGCGTGKEHSAGCAPPVET